MSNFQMIAYINHILSLLKTIHKKNRLSLVSLTKHRVTCNIPSVCVGIGVLSCQQKITHNHTNNIIIQIGLVGVVGNNDEKKLNKIKHFCEHGI